MNSPCHKPSYSLKNKHNDSNNQQFYSDLLSQYEGLNKRKKSSPNQRIIDKRKTVVEKTPKYRKSVLLEEMVECGRKGSVNDNDILSKGRLLSDTVKIKFPSPSPINKPKNSFEEAKIDKKNSNVSIEKMERRSKSKTLKKENIKLKLIDMNDEPKLESSQVIKHTALLSGNNQSNKSGQNHNQNLTTEKKDIFGLPLKKKTIKKKSFFFFCIPICN